MLGFDRSMSELKVACRELIDVLKVDRGMLGVDSGMLEVESGMLGVDRE